ncbi:MAG: plasmid mobilization relaxosome protein MobC [Sphingobacteriales bacterium]|nr:plasmid mobilization relaxosome protein MobC [Sphingobacteriales bacterium]
MSEHKIPSWISFRVRPAEYQKIHGLFSKSTHRKLSEYARNVLLQKPVTIKVRNESADQFLHEMIGLKKELNAIGNNYNQAVKKLHSLNHINEVKGWLTAHEPLHQNFLQLTESIFQQLNEIHRQWSSE